MIAVDWGTSSMRAYRLDADGTILERTEAARGLMTIPPGGYPAVLSEVVGPWLAAGERRVLICGMAGSRQGWVEAPYLPCPARPADLALATVAVAFDHAEVRIVPGLSDRDPDGVPEVMRGEETQLAGVLDAAPDGGLVCLPGSHAKWARVAGGRVEGFATYLSGEAFAAIRAGTILGRMIAEAPPDPASFARGVARSGGHGHLLHQLFGVRALGLFGELADAASASYLSGLLVGTEVRAAMPPGGRVLLVGSPALCELYSDAIGRCGGHATVAAPDAAATGLFQIARDVPWN